ncbi:hypothetical protein VCRA2133E348_70072 [Vibrio crassostreae]|nr:hypothetical protein VCRA2133E348_70072 [Vibrio crassostreae]CAK3650547.1 hypothetical protein VCRA213O314_70073 [Vibrio crassostreae]
MAIIIDNSDIKNNNLVLLYKKQINKINEVSIKKYCIKDLKKGGGKHHLKQIVLM